MIAELISIGDEIVSGAILDTNSQWLSTRLNEWGIHVGYHTTIGDDMAPMIEAFQLAQKRADLVIVTGGLGPTEDDLTRQAVAEMLKTDLVQDENSKKHVTCFFEKRKRSMPESNLIQSYFPRGAEVIPNPNGTAPGFHVRVKREGAKRTGVFHLLAFPGVPAELYEMWNAIAPTVIRECRTEHNMENHHIMHKKIHCFGAGESDIESRLPHLISRDRTPRVGITAKEGIITLRIMAESDSEVECQKQIDDTEKLIRETLGELVFGVNDDTLISVACDKLRELRHHRVATFEWGTRGLLASKFPQDCFGDACVFNYGYEFDIDLVVKWARKTKTFKEAKYLLVVGPYPAPNYPFLQGMIHIIFVDFMTGRYRVESAPPIAHPAIQDVVTCNRAFNLVRRFLSDPDLKS